MAASQWLILAEYIISLFCHAWSFCVFAGIHIRLYQKDVKNTIITSPSLNLYFIIQTITSLVNIVYMAFLLVGWRLLAAEYNSYLLYFIGGLPTIFINLPPIAAFGLGLDRCLCVIYPVKYSKKQSYIPFYLAAILMATISFYSIVFRIIPVFPVNVLTMCNSFGCLLPTSLVESYAYLRYSTSALVLITGVILLAVIRYKFSSSNNQQHTKKLNITVFLTLVTTFSLDFIPHLMSIIFYSIVNVNLTVYVGPYSTVIGALESAICAFFYRNIFKKEVVINIPPHQKTIQITK